MTRTPRHVAVALAAVLAALFAAAPTASAADSISRPATSSQASGWASSAATASKATPRARCRRGSRRETGLQGRVPAGKASAAGFRCNVQVLSHHGESGGYRVHRFVDRAGRECAYYDSTLLFPSNAETLSKQPTGVFVLDMSNPRKPVRTAALQTPAMQTPHESLVINERRGLLAAVMGNPLAYPGVVDIYDLNDDCRKPKLLSSLPVGVLGHEAAFAPDGHTFYATSLFSGNVTAVDVSNPRLPRTIWTGNYYSHGLTISENGNRAYLAARNGLQVLDTSEVQARKPLPQVREVSRLSWPTLAIPQVAIPVTIGGRPFVVEVDEFSTNRPGATFPARNGPIAGHARIIDMRNEKAPRVASNIRLGVHLPENRGRIAGDPEASNSLQGYAGHYCWVPQRHEPGIVACSMILSGLRVFDIRDPYRPREIAYFTTPLGSGGTNYAMSAPAFVPERSEIWYSDGNSGFYALRLAKGLWPSGSKDPNPLPRRCVDRRKFRFRVHRGNGARVVRVDVYINGKRKYVKRGRNIKRIAIRRLPRRKRTVVKIVTTRSDGVRSVSRRVYRGCRKGPPRTRGFHPRNRR